MYEKINNDLQDFNLFMAVGSKQYLEFLFICNVKNILVSYAYLEPWKMIGLIKRNNVNLLCDSGAFTSWNLAFKTRREDAIKECLSFGKEDLIEDKIKEFLMLPKEEQEEAYKKVDQIGKWKKHLIDIDGYLEHLNRYKDIIFRAVNLDVIPGKQGQKPTEEEVLEAAEQGWNNYLYLKSKGWNTIHVYHQGEPIWVLDRMLKDCDYIGVSPCNDSSELSKLAWMDFTFRHISKSCNPNIKTHGFAVTSPTLVKRFPWFSVDSSSYSMTAAMGNILTPYGRIYVSEENKSKKEHIQNRPQQVQDFINKYLDEEIGYKIESMAEKTEQIEAHCPNCTTAMLTTTKIQSYKPRNFANIIYYLKLQELRRKNGPTLDYLKQGTLF